MTIIFKGQEREIWWAREFSGQERGKDYFDSLDGLIQARFEAMFQRIGDWGAIRNQSQFRNEGEGFYCFKVKRHRLVCFMQKNKIVITHGFEKNSDKMPQTEKKKAKRIRQEWLNSKEEGQ